jgi:hypothetical protein
MFKIGDLVECTPFRGEPARLGFVTSHILLHGEGAIRVVYLTPFNAHFIAGVQIDHWFSAPFYGVRLVSPRSTNPLTEAKTNE